MRRRDLSPFVMFVLACILITLLVWGIPKAVPAARPLRVVGLGQIRFNGKGPEAWALVARQQRARADDLQQRLTRRVVEARDLRRTLLHRPSSLEALRLAAIVYNVPFDLLYRRASCESTGMLPATPPSERTIQAGAVNPYSSASGLLQFLDSTWSSTPFAGFDVFSPYANALAAGWMIGPAGRGREWSCR